MMQHFHVRANVSNFASFWHDWLNLTTIIWSAVPRYRFHEAWPALSLSKGLTGRQPLSPVSYRSRKAREEKVLFTASGGKTIILCDLRDFCSTLHSVKIMTEFD